MPPSRRKSQEFANSHKKRAESCKASFTRGVQRGFKGIFIINNFKIAGYSFGRFKIGAAPAVDILKITFFFGEGSIYGPNSGRAEQENDEEEFELKWWLWVNFSACTTPKVLWIPWNFGLGQSRDAQSHQNDFQTQKSS